MSTNALNYIINLNNGNFGRGMEQAQGQVSKLDSLVSKVAGTIAATFAVDRALQLTEEVTDLKAKFEGFDNTIKFASGSVENYNKNSKFLEDSITNLKLPIEQTTNSFAQFLAGVKGTSLEGDLARKIFSGVSTAATTLHLSGDKVERTFNALTQMMGKGKVQSEELRGQLGESLPGAFNLAAKAMGVTTKELNKMLDDGKVLPEELLPKLADELLKTFGPGVQNAVGSLQAKLNESSNAIIQQKIALGEHLAPVHLAWLNLQMQGFSILQTSIGFYQKHATLFNTLAVAIIGGATAYYGMVLASKAYAAYQAIAYTVGLIQLGLTEASTLGLTGMAAAQWALNVAMTANPIGIIVVGLAALVAGLIYAYNTSENFKATLAGIGAVALEIMKPLKGVGEVIFGLMTADFSLVSKGINDAIDGVKTMDIKGAYQSARASSFLASEKAAKEEATNTTNTNPLQQLMNGNGVPAAPKVPEKTKGKGETVTGGGGSSVKHVNIHIGVIKTADKLTIETTNLQNLSHGQIEQIITDSLVRAAHDGEVVIASN